MNKKTIAGFVVLEGAYWASYASFLGYATTLLRLRGVSSTHISLLVAAYMLSAFFGSFFWGAVCDRLASNRRVLLPLLPVAAGLCALFYRFAGPSFVTWPIYCLMGFAIQPLSTNLDAWLIRSARGSADIYGRVRAVGSMAYALVILPVGRLIDRVGTGVTLIGALLFLAITALSAFFLPEGGAPAVHTHRQKPSLGAVRVMLQNRSFLLLCALLFFDALAAAPANSLKVVLLESVGGTVSHVGIDSFVGVAVQAALLALAGRMQKLRLEARYLIMTGSVMLMLALSLIARSWVLVVAGTCFLNVSYAIALPTMREVTNRTVPEEVRNMGHNLTETIYNNMAGMLSLMYAGAVVDAFGFAAILKICMGIQLIPLALSVRAAVANRKN